MHVERILAVDVEVGHLVDVDDRWCTVEAVQPASDERVTLSLVDVYSEHRSRRTMPGDTTLHRSDADAVHHQDEFVGMTRDQARAWARALGWILVDVEASAGMLAYGHNEAAVRVKFDVAGRVITARMG